MEVQGGCSLVERYVKARPLSAVDLQVILSQQQPDGKQTGTVLPKAPSRAAPSISLLKAALKPLAHLKAGLGRPSSSNGGSMQQGRGAAGPPASVPAQLPTDLTCVLVHGGSGFEKAEPELAAGGPAMRHNHTAAEAAAPGAGTATTAAAGLQQVTTALQQGGMPPPAAAAAAATTTTAGAGVATASADLMQRGLTAAARAVMPVPELLPAQPQTTGSVATVVGDVAEAGSAQQQQQQQQQQLQQQQQQSAAAIPTTSPEDQQDASAGLSPPSAGQPNQAAGRLSGSPSKHSRKRARERSGGGAVGPEGAPDAEAQEAGRLQGGVWARPARGYTGRKEVADLLNKVIEVPADVFGAEVPDAYFRARVVGPDNMHEHAVIIRVQDLGNKYYFPVGQVREWVRGMQERQNQANEGLTGPAAQQQQEQGQQAMDCDG